MCSGNHDYDDKESLEWLNNIPNVYGDGTIKTIKGITFGCIPYLATEYDAFDTCTVLSHLPICQNQNSHRSKNKKIGVIEIFQGFYTTTYYAQKYFYAGMYMSHFQLKIKSMNVQSIIMDLKIRVHIYLLIINTKYKKECKCPFYNSQTYFLGMRLAN